MTDILKALAEVAVAVMDALRDFLETVRAAFQSANERRRSLVRRRDALAVVPVTPMWPPRPVPRRPYRREPHIRIRYGDIPDQYGNYPY